MPSNKARVNLTVDDELNALLDDVARLTGIPKARYIVQILQDIKPMLNELVDALEQAEQQKSVLPNLARLSAIANAQTSKINSDMSALYENQIDWVKEYD